LYAQSYEEEVAIILEFMQQFDDFKTFNLQSQVWVDLSELMTAATDNAKELILGIIGSNNDTASIIAGMTMVGIDLRESLLLVNDPIIRKAIDERTEQNSLSGSNKTESGK
jgi:hypothetical protein